MLDYNLVCSTAVLVISESIVAILVARRIREIIRFSRYIDDRKKEVDKYA